MVENRPVGKIFSHLILLGGVAAVIFPLYLTLVASTHPVEDLTGRVPAWFGTEAVNNYRTVLGSTSAKSGSQAVGPMLMNSLIMAMGVALGKVAVSIISAYALIYFRFPLRKLFFWLIFITLMLPVEVRILPTYKVVADLNLLDSYGGLILPLIASATATFLFRQFFLTIPRELFEASRIDGGGPIRFFFSVVAPLSRTNMAALFVILFIFGWNQYLWPLLVTTESSMYTVVMGIQRMIYVADTQAMWNLIAATAVLAMLPPVLVVVLMQRLFVKGLVEVEK